MLSVGVAFLETPYRVLARVGDETKQGEGHRHRDIALVILL